MRKIFYAAAAAMALCAFAALVDERVAFAQQAVPTISRKTETLACASPCAVSANNTLVFNDTASASPTATSVDVMRSKWTCRNIGANDAFICKGATCSSAAYDYILTAAGKDSYTEDSGTVWGGKISAASTGASLVCAGQLR